MIERSHHHILWSRIPHYARGDLLHVQSVGKSVFEYWAHALAYIPACDYRFFMPAMKRHRENPTRWFAAAAPAEMRRILARIRDEGPLTIRDIDDDDLVERDHPWASRGQLTISARSGMVKTYELTDRHFGWPPRPRAASERQILEYLLHRALRAQGVVSLDSACYMDVPRKKAMAALIEARVVRRRKLVPVTIKGGKLHWATPETFAEALPERDHVHILSPFDPLVIRRKRLALFFDYDHRFEAYLPAAKRQFGYFALPVLVGDRVAAAIDCKADRRNRRLLIQQWTWIDGPRDGDRDRIDDALARFEAFQLG